MSRPNMNTIQPDLKKLIDEGQWDFVLAAIKTNKFLCRKRYNVHFVTDGNEQSEVLPIHHACSKMQVPLNLIKAMIEAYPDSTLKREITFKRTCLHIAILKCLPDSIISTIIESNPSIVKLQDHFGRVPLHYACSKLRSAEVIKKLIMPFPQCILAPDSKHWTSFHVAVTKNTHPDIIEFMMNLFPEVVSMRTMNGTTPLELMMDEEVGTDSKMPLERKVKLSKMILEKIDELNERPESRNYLEARNNPGLPVELNPYGIV